MNPRTSTTPNFCAWAQRQAEPIRAGRLEDVDFEHVAEEIERTRFRPTITGRPRAWHVRAIGMNAANAAN